MHANRTILIGDIHGCLDEFNELVKKVGYQPDKDKLILLGDLIDRGPDSVGVVRRAQELNAVSVSGNHEQAYIKWFRSNKKVYDKKKHYEEFSDDDIEYIHKMPLYLKFGNYVVVHAGVKPGIAFEDQSMSICCYLRFIDKDWNQLSLRKVLRDKMPGAIFWTDFWQGPESIVYGHHVHSYEDPKIDERAPGVKCFGIDTGCCFGGKLTAMILETQEMVQVQAKQIYYKSDFKDL